MCSTRRNRWNNKNNSYNNKKKFSSWNSFIYNYFIFLRPILTLNKNNGLLNFLVCKQLLVILSTIWRQDRFIVEFYQVLACRKGSTSTSKTLLTDAGLSWSQNVSCFFCATSHQRQKKNNHLFQTFEWPKLISSVHYWS